MERKVAKNPQKVELFNTTCYMIEIGYNILHNQHNAIASLGNRCAIITDDLVATLYGTGLCQSLRKSGIEAYLFSFPHGEPNKTRATKEYLEDQLFQCKLGRDTVLVALGGGVVTDIAGYIASTYCRGIPLVLMPTTLLCMVDASIGGKNGINLAFGKNLIGTIYQAKKVVMDLATLHTLPKKEFSQGMVEMIKHGLILDGDLFEQLENKPLLEKVIKRSCQIKQKIVVEDEKESGKRRLLNFGHTVAHALEKISHYTITHGEAVAIGLVVESKLSMRMQGLSCQSYQRVKKVLQKYELPIEIPSAFSMKELWDAMLLDKKSVKAEPRFVMIDAIGSALSFEGDYCKKVSQEEFFTNNLAITD